MIVFHIDPDCLHCHRIHDDLDQTALAHRIVEHDGSQPVGGVPPHTLVDEERIFYGHEAMARHIEDLAKLAKRWSRFQSDACYCDEDED